MAKVTLFPPTQEPVDFEEATEITLNQGTLMFHGRKDSDDHVVRTYITNMPFLWIE